MGPGCLVIVIPALTLLLIAINRHYRRVAREVERPLQLKVRELQALVVMIPVDGWNLVTEKALRLGLLLFRTTSQR